MKHKLFLGVIISSFIFISSYAQEDILVEVIDIKTAEDVVNLQPVNISDEFPANIEKVYCWTKIKAFEIPTFVIHEWYYKNRLMASVKLKITGPIFRTWSSKRIIPSWKGKWRVIVKDENGSIVASKEFIIK